MYCKAIFCTRIIGILPSEIKYVLYVRSHYAIWLVAYQGWKVHIRIDTKVRLYRSYVAPIADVWSDTLTVTKTGRF